ncbi:MAG: urate hydroxylase PuuD [Elusimicrobia bacterium]|nr:urate hydroxylase PuuD [Elusimicrobiota bacterium]
MVTADLILDCANLALRWAHVIFGITWIGQTYLFNRMERVLEPPRSAGNENISGELWMVHGGGFYLVEKQKWPEIMPRTLHWFKWESALTWMSGTALLAVAYWAGAPLLEYGSTVSRGFAIAISLGTLVFGWIVYSLIWNSPVARNELIGAGVSWMLIILLARGLGSFLSDRAVYLHIGAVMGTIMAANVWMRILPSQKKMMKITQEGGVPDQNLARRARRASRHNTFMSVPLIFLMLSSHYPALTYGHPWRLQILGALIILGWLAAQAIRRWL